MMMMGIAEYHRQTRGEAVLKELKANPGCLTRLLLSLKICAVMC